MLYAILPNVPSKRDLWERGSRGGVRGHTTPIAILFNAMSVRDIWEKGGGAGEV